MPPTDRRLDGIDILEGRIMPSGDIEKGASCGLCNREMTGEIFAVDLVLKNKNIKDEHVVGYQCQNCGASVCSACMENKFDKANWRRTLCPKCGIAFGPYTIMLGNHCDEQLKTAMRERQRSLENRKNTIPVDWKSMLIGVAAIAMGAGISEYLKPPFTALLIIFGVLSILSGAAPRFRQDPKVILLQAANSLVVGVICTLIVLAAKANPLPIAFFAWVVYRQLLDYRSWKSRLKGR
jgi:hypothetical protein